MCVGGIWDVDGCSVLVLVLVLVLFAAAEVVLVGLR